MTRDPRKPNVLADYERLSLVYEMGWGGVGKRYMPLITKLLEERGIRNARIVDLGCGTGELARELARLGHRVLAVDRSAEMIQLARTNTADSAVEYRVESMEGLHVKDKYEIATCTFNCLNYLLDPIEVENTFLNVAAGLVPGGLFVFDSNTELQYERNHSGTIERELGGDSFLQELLYEPDLPLATTTFRFPDGTMEVHKQRPYSLQELEPLLDKSQLVVRETYKNLKLEPYAPLSERLICVCEKGRTSV
jgi:SAM-dependent methyltransferase